MVRDRFAAPAPPPERDAAIRDALRDALARQPLRMLLVDRRAAETIDPAALVDATAALAAHGVAMDVATRLPGDAAGLDLVVAVARAHDGGEWVGTLRAAGFAGPVVGWLVEDDRDPAANQDIARAIDIVVPARVGRRSALLQEHALVLPALAPPGGPTAPHATSAPHETSAPHAASAPHAVTQDVPDTTNARHEADQPMMLAFRLQALVAALRDAARLP
jgi:hypothetical protein